MMYHVMIPSTRVDAPAFEELTKTESYKNAQAIADDHKANTGQNCYVESRAVVYVTSTIDEAISQLRDDRRAKFARDMGPGHTLTEADPQTFP